MSLEPRDPFKVVDLAAYAAAGWPDLRRGMVAMVEVPPDAPWYRQALQPVAIGIRRAQGRIFDLEDLGTPEERRWARLHHAQIYAIEGCFASQNAGGAGYPNLEHCRGLILHLWDPPLPWPDSLARAEGVIRTIPRNGAPYGFRDIYALERYSWDGDLEGLRRRLDHGRDICSEAAYRVITDFMGLDIGGGHPCPTPMHLAIWLIRAGWRHQAIRLQ